MVCGAAYYLPAGKRAMAIACIVVLLALSIFAMLAFAEDDDSDQP